MNYERPFPVPVRFAAIDCKPVWHEFLAAGRRKRQPIRSIVPDHRCESATISADAISK
jgi:hypothetical protein